MKKFRCDCVRSFDGPITNQLDFDLSRAILAGIRSMNELQRTFWAWPVAVGLLFPTAQTLLSATATSADSTGIDFFEQKIRPIFVESCYKCHSKESEKVKGGLLVDTRDGLLKGGDNGPAIV